MITPDGPKGSVPRTPVRAEIVAQFCGVLTAGIGILALVGWLSGLEALHRVRADYVPTAPSTALAFVLLGAAAFALARWPERRAARTYVNAAAGFVSVLVAILIGQFIGGFDLGLESALSPVTETFEGARAGRMSPLAAGGLLLAALSLISLTTYPSDTTAGRRVAGGMSFGTLAIGVLALAGYALGAPLLYHSVVTPVALPSALGLSLLGAGILATAILAPRTGVLGGEGRPRRRPGFMRYVPAALGAGATVLLTVVAAGIVRQLDRTRAQDAFNSAAHVVAAALQNDIDLGLTNLRSVRAAITIDEELTRPEFHTIADASRPPDGGGVAIAWAPRVPNEARAQFEAAARRDLKSDFRVKELGPTGGLVVAGRREDYYPIADVEPPASYESLLGFDARTEAAVAEAMTRARNDSAPTVSDAFDPVTDTTGERTVVAILPVVRGPRSGPADAQHEPVFGYVIGILRVGDMVRSVDPTLDSQGIALTLRDLRPGEPPPLYGRPQAAPAYPLLSQAETLEVAGRRWQAVFVPTATYASLHPRWSAWALLAGGLLFAFLIGAHLFGMEGYAADLENTRETLRTSEARFRAISESAVDGIITVDATGTIVQCNAAAIREFGYEDGGLLGRNVRDIVPPSHVAAHDAGLARYATTGVALAVGEALELPARRRDGSDFPIELSLAVWETHEGRFATAILRDITERQRGRDEREHLIAELQDTLANVKTLRGLLPVCAWCRKVLDDRGAWRQMEAYVSEHTEAEFSHGMCPSCEKKFADGEV